jgi:hypothetical protein
MVDFDNRLLALADCSVVPHKRATDDSDLAGGIIFDPYPSITASNDEVLAHELCHRIAGKREYDIFLTAVVARKMDELYKFILNLLVDWYHECLHENYSPFLKKKLADLHIAASKVEIGKAMKSSKVIVYLMNDLYMDRKETPQSAGIDSCHSLVFIADKLYAQLEDKKQLTKEVKVYITELNRAGITGAGSSSYGEIPKRSNFYIKTIAKYGATIGRLEHMWTRNKYGWVNRHFGEINWKNLVGLYTGEKLMLPVFTIMKKIILKKRVHICIDRSGSTNMYYKNTGTELKYMIMEIAIMIAESLRRCGAPISVLDVGVQDKIINKIEEPLDTGWFHPMASGGTPLGAVCGQIRERDPNSLLIIITDGDPDSFETLSSAIHRFPGDTVTFVIGNSYASYASRIPNTICAQPHTIIHDLERHMDKGVVV